MLKLRKVAVTGNPAAGKSTVCKLFKKLGAYTLNSDQIVRTLLKNDLFLQKQIVRLLGKKILTNGKIDRSKVAAIVFKDLAKLKRLEKLLHPKVIKKIKAECRLKQKEGKYPLLLAEVPLLFETGLEKMFDQVLCVDAPQALARRRFGKGYLPRQKRQLDLKIKRKKSDLVLKNNRTLADLKKNVKKLYELLTQKEFA
ncbi:MAG: dephospho-CoA kinase [Parachlamydiales bacterium]|jgi:dephospho-CoA kinase